MDQLGERYPNPEFVASSTRLLEEAGYEVTYVPADQVTVALYQDLPAGEYDLILLRSHSARQAVKDGDLAEDVTLFTAERFDFNRYGDAIAARRVGAVFNEYEDTVDPANAPGDASELGHDGEGATFGGRALHFGVRGAFIEQDMRGRLKRGPLVVLMGCDGLRGERMARAFVEKGARTFISWDKPVSLPHTDAAAELLLSALLVDGLSPEEAVRQTMAAVGPDEEHGSELGYFPP